MKKGTTEYFYVAVYLRLSKDDEDLDHTKIESNSISSQRKIIENHVKSMSNAEIVDEYIDDGYSGLQFERPEFQRMMQDIDNGKVNCVIVKDLSRFGRDYLESGRFIQRIFPEKSVRFIAIGDSFDSLTASSTDENLIVPVKNFMNQSYSADISKKVLSSQKVKRENGEYIGNYTSYGYLKSPENKNKLIVDDYAAGIIKNIFAWKIDGQSSLDISSRLNALGILSPAEYKKSIGIKYQTSFKLNVKSSWSVTSVNRILQNEIYTGTMVQGKRSKVNYKIKKVVENDRDSWVCVEGTHEPIVSEKDFFTVQSLLQYDTRKNNSGEVHIYAGILFCADCGRLMVRRVTKYKGKITVYFICATHNKGEGCSRHSIKEEQLSHILVQMLQQHIEMFADIQGAIQNTKSMSKKLDDIMQFDKQIAMLKNEAEKYNVLKSSLYADLKEGLLDEAEFNQYRKMYSEKCIEINQAIINQEEMIKKIYHQGIVSGDWLQHFKQHKNIQTVTRAIIISFINRIEIFENKEVKIKYKYQDEINTVFDIEEVIKADNRFSDGRRIC